MMTQKTLLLPPIADRKPFDITVLNHTRIDPYYWLRERENPKVISYLKAENRYTRENMAHTEALQETLYKEMVGRIKETDESVPVKHGEYYYYYRTIEGQQYRIYCRKHKSLEADEEVLLDLNLLAENEEYLRLGVFSISPDHNLLAYSLDTNGSEFFTVYFKDLESETLLEDQIPNTTYSGEWGNDNQTYFYTTEDAAKRPHRLFRHRLGVPLAEDEMLFEEKDMVYRVYLDKTKDYSYLLLYSISIESSEVHFLNANNPAGQFAVIQPREKNHRYQVCHHTGTFYILTNENAKNNKLMTASVNHPGKENWLELLPHQEKVKLEDVELFSRHMVVYKRQNGLKEIAVTHLETGVTHQISFPEPVYSYMQEQNPEFDTNQVRFNYRSLTTPDSIFDYNMNTREMMLKKRKPVLGDFNPENYVSERLFATASDGAQVPISLVYRKGVSRDGNNPCLLYGYGSYGHSIDPFFPINQLSLINRGVIFAIAHIRGGGEMGRHWYDQGKFLNKKNTFTDFVTCGQHLFEKQYTSPENLAIMGRSAGGLLMGAVLNLAPELCKVAVAGVPFVDVVTTMLDETIPLTVNEFEEWGNPKDKKFYEYMLSYSPYDNVEAKNYPHILVTTGLNDPRVAYWEPAKWVAKLRITKTADNFLLLKTNMGAGHGGSSGRYDYLKEIAFDYAFVLDRLGIV